MTHAGLLVRAYEIGLSQVEAEILRLVELVSDLAPRICLEIGSGQGGSTYLWTALASHKCISVDLPGGPWGGVSSEAFEARRRRVAEAGRIDVVPGDSHSPRTLARVAECLGHERADFLFIDGDHSRIGVALDYYMYSALVCPGGLIAFHDIVESEHHRALGCEVSDFWTHLPGSKEELCAGLDWGGIGVLRVP